MLFSGIETIHMPASPWRRGLHFLPVAIKLKQFVSWPLFLNKFIFKFYSGECPFFIL